MIYKHELTEKNAIMRVAELMSAAARTAPKACGVDVTETLVIDGDDKDRLSAVMREIGGSVKSKSFFIRDAGNVDASACVVLIASSVNPRKLNCAMCGAETCSEAVSKNISCAMAVNDVGIATGSAAATAMDHRIDNRILFSAGVAALKLGLFSDTAKICFGIGLSVSGKNIFFDRPQ